MDVSGLQDLKLYSRRFFAAAGGALAAPVTRAREGYYAAELPDMLLGFVAGKLNALAERWDRERDAIRTPAALEQRNRFVREKVREMVHGFPERTPLEAHTTGVLERSAWRVENVMFRSRPEVDSERIGCAGHSGGGTLTLFLSALDERIRCAVVCQGGTSHRWPVRLAPGSRLGPSDVEQSLFPAALYGIDLCDLHVAIAPRPLLASIEEYSPQFNLAAEHIRRRYAFAGVPERFAAEEAADPHAWTVKLRLATTNWFCRWFLGREGPREEPDVQTETPERLYVTPLGRSATAGKGRRSSP